MEVDVPLGETDAVPVEEPVAEGVDVADWVGVPVAMMVRVADGVAVDVGIVVRDGEDVAVAVAGARSTSAKSPNAVM